MKWRTEPRHLDEPWLSKSECGHYAIAAKGPQFEAFHIAALWARPVSIGSTFTLDLAQQLSEHHFAQPRV